MILSTVNQVLYVTDKYLPPGRRTSRRIHDLTNPVPFLTDLDVGRGCVAVSVDARVETQVDPVRLRRL